MIGERWPMSVSVCDRVSAVLCCVVLCCVVLCCAVLHCDGVG